MIGKKGFQPGNKLGLKHGCASRGNNRSYLYTAWHHIFDRCYKATDKVFKWYGARGIQVCARWHKGNPNGFLNFINDVGARPSRKHSIDRINNDGHYMPSNIRWATSVEQRNNQRRYRGEDHASSVLTEIEVRKIKLLVTQGLTTKQILQREGYKVSVSTINHIRQGKTWAHVVADAHFQSHHPIRAGWENQQKLERQNPQ